MAIRRLTVLGIIIAASGCDNVGWGGFEMRLEAPPSKSPSPVVTEDSSSESPARPALPAGPVLYMGRRDGSRLTLVPVGEVRGRNLVPLPTEAESPGFQDYFAQQRLEPGTIFTLYSEGVRVGSMVAEETGSSGDFCRPRPTVSGRVELVPEAAEARRFLAFARDGQAGPGFEAYAPLSHNYDQRVASLNMMGGVITKVGARWPPSVLAIRRDIQVFQLEPHAPPAVVATFVYRDTLRVGPAGRGAYSVFLMGTDEGTGYRTSYAAYRESDTRGKGAPRFFDRLDWDGDGSPEVLLEVMGETAKSLAAIRRTNGHWTDLFLDACGGELGGSAPTP